MDAEKETFDFLGFTFRRAWNRERTKRVTLYFPSKKAQQRLRDKVRKTLSARTPFPVPEQVAWTNRVLRGWVNYFRVGNSSEVFHDIRYFVECRLRRVLQRQAKRRGCGWNRYASPDLYRRFGLYSDYAIRYVPLRL